MSAPDQIRAMFNTTISVQLVTGFSAGDEVLGTLVTGIPAYVEDRVEKVTGADGSDLVSKHFIATEYALLTSHRIWLASDDTSKPEESKRPMMIERFNNPEVNPATTSHCEVRAG